MKRKIKIGQLGMGHNHGAAKMETVRKFPELFEVVGIAEPNEKWLRQRGALPAYAGLPVLDAGELLATPGLDAVLVETDVPELLKAAQMCIDAGKHIHLDKPAGQDIAAYARLLSDAEAGHLTVQLGYMYRYNPAVQYCLAKVKDGTLGELFAVDAVMSTEHPAEYRRWLRNFQGGTLYIFGCHLIDLVLSLWGMPESITAYQKKTFFDSVDVYDNGFAVLNYRQGVATVRASSVEVNGFGRRQLVVCGSKGSIEIKPLERPTVLCLTLKDYSSPYCDKKKIIPLPETAGRYDEMMLDFAKMVRGERKNPYSSAYELTLQKAILKACGFSEIDL